MSDLDDACLEDQQATIDTLTAEIQRLRVENNVLKVQAQVATELLTTVMPAEILSKITFDKVHSALTEMAEQDAKKEPTDAS